MSTATLETPRAASQREIDDYRMPKAHLGQFVMFYPDCHAKESAGVVAQVIGVSRIYLYLNTFGHDTCPQSFISQQAMVRHRTDPKLKTQNPFIIKYGCWDYTPWELELRSEVADLKASVAKLIGDLGGPTKSKKAE